MLIDGLYPTENFISGRDLQLRLLDMFSAIPLSIILFQPTVHVLLKLNHSLHLQVALNHLHRPFDRGVM